MGMPYAKLAIAAAFATSIACVANAAQPSAGPAPRLPTTTPSTSEVSLPRAERQTHALTQQDLDTFFDGIVPYAIAHGDIAGGVVSVVKDGKLFFAKGYGYADLKTKQSINPEATLFRPGSISKLFTWTSVM